LPWFPIGWPINYTMTRTEPRDVGTALAAVVAAIGGDDRAGQLQMSEAVAAALNGDGHLLVQAGTGTGKSVAYLTPAVLRAVSSGEPVVIATATLALQRQLIEMDLPRVVAALEPLVGRVADYAVLKGRANYVCRSRLNFPSPESESEPGLFDVSTGALAKAAKFLREWAEETETGDRDDLPESVDPRVWRAYSVTSRECVGATKCEFGSVCFAELARDRAREADIVVTNHALLSIGVLEGIPVLPEHCGVIVDEGHELVDRATNAVSVELNVRAVERAAARSRSLLDTDVLELLQDAADGLGGALAEQAAQIGGEGTLIELGQTLLLALTSVRDAGHVALGELAGDRDGSDPDAINRRQQALAAIETVHDIAGRILGHGTADVVWVDTGDFRAPTLHLAPLSVAAVLRAALFDETAVVVTSATLALGGSFESVARSMGLDGSGEGWTGLDVGSPFDHAQQGILYVAAHLPRPAIGVSEEAIALLGDLIEAAGGRTLALFSSWRGVETAAEILQDRFAGRADRPLLVQRRGDATSELVRRFREDQRTSLLGTITLWQGVDVPGDSCTCVVIDRLPFPRPDDPLLSARARAAEESGASGFASVMVPRAALMLAQGVGRLIRSHEDRGVVAILDSRLATAGYGNYLRRSLPPFWYTNDLGIVMSSLSRLDEEAVRSAEGR
jgi:ATP-dependent DNA helicase DinG